ncbi:hypothetical protein EI94DRAFT_1708952 [Lactarius quietus]|nr:hypothetical protein EI94DRAFT_1708952 [Lactarius quietus]
MALSPRQAPRAESPPGCFAEESERRLTVHSQKRRLSREGYARQSRTPAAHRSQLTKKGRRDGKIVDAAAAVIPSAWGGPQEAQEHDQAFELGEGVSQYDVDAFGISLAGQAILSYLKDGGEARQFTILSRSQAAIMGISDQNSRAIQEHALNFAHSSGRLQTTNSEAFAMPYSGPNKSAHNSRMKMLNHIPEAEVPRGGRRAMGKRMACQAATNTCLPAISPPPPDGNNHPIWKADMKDKPSRSSFCTALRLAVGHSFTAEYTRRFKKEFEPLDGSDEAQIDNRRVRPSIYDLFSTLDGARQLFKFLGRATAAHKPAGAPWLPGVPRLDPTTDGWYWDDSIT